MNRSVILASGALLAAALLTFSGFSSMVFAADTEAQPSAADSAGPQPASPSSQAQGQSVPAKTYTAQETIQAANDFFGGTTQGLATAIQKAFSELGEPNAYIVGNEGSGAVIVGLRYGAGTLKYKGGGSMPVYWQGPSVGWDFGGNASKVFMLVYDLHMTNQLFHRYPGVDGSLYVVAGVGLNYLRSDGVTVAPIRTGVGLRAGANVGYISFSRERTWNPF